MEEVFQDTLASHSINVARRRYFLEVIKLLKPVLIKRVSGTQRLNLYGMVQHNIIFSFRIFKRYKTAFLINLTGLTTGLASVLLIYLWVSDELAVDRFHEKGDRLYQVMGNEETQAGISTWNGTSALLAKALENEVPEIEHAVPGTDPGWNISFDLNYEDKRIKAVGKHVGEEYFNLFSYQVLQGDFRTTLTTPNSMAISDQLALNLFNTTSNVLGKTLKWKTMYLEGESVITSVFKSPPSNSTDQFDFLLPFETYTKDFGEGWANPNSVTYVLLNPGADLEAVNTKLKSFLKSKLPDSEKALFLTPYQDQYLYGRFENGVIAGGRIEYVRLFSLVAAFILVIAAINFMNLSTARASRRLREIGVKKAIGASRKTLIFQHLIESLIMAFIAMILALVLVHLVLPFFNGLTGKSLALAFTSQLTSGCLIIGLVTGLLSGSYPALYLSGFKPVAVLKGLARSSPGALWVRKGLVIFQFTITIIFIMGVLVVYQQMELIHNKSLGFDKDNIVYFEREGSTVEDLDPFLEGIRNLPGVVHASAINNDFFNPPGAGDLTWDGMIDEPKDFSRFMVNYHFVETIGAKLKAGRDFSKDFPLRDEWQLIINETAASRIGFDDPVGKRLKLWGIDAEIIGVVQDFHFRSLHESIGPMFFQLNPRFLTNAMIRIEAGNTPETMKRIEDYYEAFNPGFTLNYKFLDQDFQAQYEAEQKVASLSKYFALLAILISCLGLLGLVAFTTERRTKEIGIRKVLGAKKLNIALSLSGDFTKMVMISLLIALPISYFLGKGWLNSFAYPIELKWWYFAFAAITGLLITWLTVGFQTVKAASTNPVKSLRSE